MQVFVLVAVVAVAQLIAYSVATVFYHMHDVVLLEEGQCAKYARLVDSQYFVFQLCQ
jgi:hypothetical protein